MADVSPTPSADDIDYSLFKKVRSIFGGDDQYSSVQWSNLDPLQKKFILETLGIIASENSLTGLAKSQDVFSQRKKKKKVSPSTWNKAYNAISAADEIEGS